MARLRSSCALSVWFLSQRFHFYLARLSAASAGSRWAKFQALTRNLYSPRNATSVKEQRSPDRHFVESAAWKPPLLESRSSPSLGRGNADQSLGGNGKSYRRVVAAARTRP